MMLPPCLFGLRLRTQRSLVLGSMAFLFLSFPTRSIGETPNAMLPPLERIYEWLSWGEFDSVIVALNPLLSQNAPKSPAETTSLTWLGIAYYGVGNPVLGDSAFQRFLAHRPQGELEANLASPEIRSRFKQLSAERARAVLSEQAQALPKSAPPSLRTASLESSGTKHAWVWVAASTVALGLTASATWWLWPEKKAKDIDHIVRTE